MKNSNKEVILNDDDIKQLGKLTTELTKLTSALSQRDSELAKIQNSLGNAINSEAISKAVTAMGTVGTAVQSLVVKLSGAESNIANISNKIAMSFANLQNSAYKNKGRKSGSANLVGWTDADFSEAKTKVAELSTLLTQLQGIANQKGGGTSSNMGALAQMSSEIKADIALYKSVISEYNSLKGIKATPTETEGTNQFAKRKTKAESNIQDTQTYSEDFKGMLEAESAYNKIITLASTHLTQLNQIAELNQKIGLINSENTQQLAGLTAYYKQISDLSNATAQNSTFDAETASKTESQKTQVKTKQQSVKVDSASTEEAKALADVTAQRKEIESVTAKQAQAQAQVNALSDEESRATAVQAEKERIVAAEMQRQVQIDAQILVLEEKLAAATKEIASARATGNTAQLQSATAATKQYSRSLNALKSTQKSTVQTSDQYYNTTGQVIQVLREMPNFAISAQTGLMSLSNNLPMLMDGFRTAAKAGGGLTTVLKGLVNTATLLNVAFVLITMVIMNLDDIIKWLTGDFVDVGEAADAAADGIGDMSSEAGEALGKIVELDIKLRNAAQGFIDGKEAIMEYNDSLGEIAGYALTAGDAIENLRGHMGEMMKDIINYAIYQEIIKQSQDKIAAEVKEWLGSDWINGEGFEINEDFNNGVESLKKIANGKASILDYSDVRKDLLEYSAYGEISQAEYKKYLKEINDIDFNRVERDKNGNVDEQTQKGLDKIAEIYRKVYEKRIKASRDKLVKKIKDEFVGAEDIAGVFATDNPMKKKKTSGSGSNSKSVNFGNVRIKERRGDEVYIEEEYYNRKRAELEMELNQQKIIYEHKATQATKEQLEIRIKAYKRAYQIQEELSHLDLEQSIHDIETKRAKEKADLEEHKKRLEDEIKDDETTLNNQKKKITDYENSTQYTRDKSANIVWEGNKVKLDAQLKDVAKSLQDVYLKYDKLKNIKVGNTYENRTQTKSESELKDLNLSEEALKEITDAQNVYNTALEEYERLMSQNTAGSNLKALETAKKNLADMEAILARSKNNLTAFTKQIREQMKIIDKNYETRNVEAVTKYIIAISDQRLKMAQGIEALVKPNLSERLRELKTYYDLLNKINERTTARQSRRVNYVGGNTQSYKENKEQKDSSIEVYTKQITELEKELSKLKEEYSTIDIKINSDGSVDLAKDLDLSNKIFAKQVEISKLKNKAETNKVGANRDYRNNTGSNIASDAMEILGSGLSSYKRPEFANIVKNSSIKTNSLDKEIKALEAEKQSTSEIYQDAIKKITEVLETSIKEGKTSQEAADSYVEERKKQIKKTTGRDATKEEMTAINKDAEFVKKGIDTNLKASDIVEGTQTAKDAKNAEEDSNTKIKEKSDEKTELELKTKEELYEQIKQMGIETLQSTLSLMDSIMEASIQRQQNALDAWTETQTKMIEDQYESGFLTEKEYNAQKDALEAERRKKQHEIDMREFKYKKASAIADIAMSSAIAIAFAIKTAFEDGGAGAPALAILYSALIAANAGIQIAAVEAQAAPAYAEGTDYHKGGLAIVGDGGQSELIKTPSGNLYKTPSSPTLIDLQKGSKVYPNFDKAMFGYDSQEIKVVTENEKELSLLKQTNRSLSVIANNTRRTTHNYNLRNW